MHAIFCFSRLHILLIPTLRTPVLQDALRSLEMARFTRRYPVVLETLMKQMLAMVHVSGLQCLAECMVECMVGCMSERIDECTDISACMEPLQYVYCPKLYVVH